MGRSSLCRSSPVFLRAILTRQPLPGMSCAPISFNPIYANPYYYGSWIHSLFFEPIYIYAASTSSTFGLLLRSRIQLPITWCCSSSLHALRLVLGFVRGLVFWHRPKRQYSTRLVLVEYRASGVFNINNRLASSGSGASPASRTHYTVH